MALTLFEYRKSIIGKILSAASKEEVKQIIDKAMDGLEDHEVVSHIDCNFSDNMLNDLDQFNPIDVASQQWANIHIARVTFNCIKTTSMHKI